MALEPRDIMFAVDAGGRIMHISAQCAALTGYTADELTSGQLPPNWIIYPADYERVMTQARSAVSRQSPEPAAEAIECRIVRQDGQMRWVSFELAPVWQDGQLTAIQGVAHDITAHKQAELALRARTQELAALNLLAARLSQSLDPKTILTEALGILMDVVGAEWGGVYQIGDEGLSPQVVNGLPDDFQADLAQYVYGPARPLAQAVVRREYLREAGGQVPLAGKQVGMQSWVALPLRDRERVMGAIVLASHAYEHFGSGDLDFLTAASDHIGLEIRNARLFAESQRRLTELALLNEAGRAVTSTLDRQAVLREIMTRAIEVLQTEAGSVLLLEPGDPATDTEPALVFAVAAGPFGDTLRGVRVPLQGSLAGQALREARPLMVLDAQRDERLYRPIDERTSLVTRNLLAVPLVVRGQVIGVVETINKLDGQFTAADLSLLESLAQPAAAAIENARLYEQALERARQLERSQAQLIQSEKLAAMGRLTASLAHEINNPLQAVLNFLYLALDSSVDEARRRGYLEIARQETDRLAKLVNHMLDFYRPAPAAGGGLDVNAALERVLALARKKLQSSNVEVETRLAQGLPSAAGALDQISQVFINLIVNAAEAMSSGGRLVITSALDPSGRWVEVSFADNGPGIAAQDLPHIFEPFYTTKQAGVGLGLAVSCGLVEAQGGMLEAASPPGHGATFTVRLPVAVRQRQRRRASRKQGK